MDISAIDLVLIVSLSFLALSSIIFLVFFIPVLVQLTKVLSELKTLINLVNHYVEAVHNKLNSATSSVNKAFGYVSNLGSSLLDTFMGVFSKK